MPSKEPEPQPQPALHPVPAPRSASAGPEAASLGPLPADSGQQPQTQAQPFLIPDPGEVVIVAPRPAMPIAKGLPGPGLLAHLIVSKYTDHMPLHRLQRAYERQGYPRSRIEVVYNGVDLPANGGSFRPTSARKREHGSALLRLRRWRASG